jgi:hypothetical protein
MTFNTDYDLTISRLRVAAARPKALPMADGQTIGNPSTGSGGSLRLPLPPALRELSGVMRMTHVEANLHAG